MRSGTVNTEAFEKTRRVLRVLCRLDAGAGHLNSECSGPKQWDGNADAPPIIMGNHVANRQRYSRIPPDHQPPVSSFLTLIARIAPEKAHSRRSGTTQQEQIILLPQIFGQHWQHAAQTGRPHLWVMDRPKNSAWQVYRCFRFFRWDIIQYTLSHQLVRGHTPHQPKRRTGRCQS